MDSCEHLQKSQAGPDMVNSYSVIVFLFGDKKLL